MTVRTTRALAVVVAAATAVVGLLVLSLTLSLDPLSRDAAAASGNALFVVGMTILAGTGALVVRAGRHPTMGWLLLSTGFANVVGRLVFGLAVAAQQANRDLLASYVGWLSNWSWIPGVGLALLLLLHFPDGELVSAWRRVVRWLIAGWTVLAVLVTALVPGPLGAAELEPLTNPVGLAPLAATLDRALVVVFLVNPALLLVVTVSTVLRWRRAEDRRQLRVVALAVVLLTAASLLALAAGESSLTESLAWLILPTSVAYAVARHDLWDVDLRSRLDRLHKVRDEERSRLQRDLHDSLGPLLGSISMRAEAARNLLAAEAPRDRVEDVLASISCQAESAVVEVRRVIDELGPSALADRDLVPAITELLENHTGGETRFVLRVDQPLPPLSPAAEVALYRVASEAVRNVVRHSRARLCTVSLGPQGTQVELEVTDDGVGLRNRPEGVGRRAMAQRISSIGGDFSLVEPKTGGVRLAARVAALEAR